MLSILTPSYLASQGCSKELDGFCSQPHQLFGLRVEDKNRVFKVMPSPHIPTDQHPVSLKGSTGYQFYSIDQMRGTEDRFRRTAQHDSDQRYWLKLDDLARDIAFLLKKMRMTATGELTSPTVTALASLVVYLAEVTDDLIEQRDEVKRALEQHNVKVLPEFDVLQSAPASIEATREALSRAQLSVHLLGQYYGRRPAGENRSFIHMQYLEALEESKRRGLPRISWLRKDLDLSNADQRQKGFLSLLENDPGANGELLKTGMEELKEFIISKVARPPSSLFEKNFLREINRHEEIRTMNSIELHSDAHLGVNNPFPGLRPFDVNESELLFGREDEIQELLSRLRRIKFQAVVGSSGCGKSSLVRAGLVASLQDGFMAETTAPWRIATMRPGNDPVGQLALALNKKQALGGAGFVEEESAVMRQAALRRSTLGLVEAFEGASLPPGSKLLVLVDQFEELFRFVRDTTTGAKDLRKKSEQAAALRRVSAADEAQAFVKLLLAAAESSAAVYVVLTMRSEFLGHCANFSGLPEAINRGLYLLPQMNREQLRDAIEGPVQFFEGEISPRLVNRLLNDLGDADQLPILQHAMMRMWTEWSPDRAPGPIDLEHYKSIGQLSASLSAHAEETFATLTESQKDIAELLFRTITETTEDQQTVRRPAEFSVICEIVRNAREQNAAPVEELAIKREVTSVIDKFREEGRCFLIPSAGTPLEPKSVIDISHESLIRQWTRLREWAEKKAHYTKLRRRLNGAADEWQEKNRTDPTLLYTGARLLEAEEYARDRGITLTPLEKEFLEVSDVQREAERTKKLEEAKRETSNRFQRRAMIVLIIAILISSTATIFAIREYSSAREAEQARLAQEKVQAAQQEIMRAQQTVLEQNNLVIEFKKELQAYGLKAEQLSNIDTKQQIAQKSVDANKEPQQIPAASNQSDDTRKKSIVVAFYRKKADKEVVAGVLSGLGFQIEAKRPVNNSPTNIIWVNPEVIDSGLIKPEDVKLIAYALIRAGIQIKHIGPPNGAAWRENRQAKIWIGANESLYSRPTLTVEQVRNLPHFRDKP